MCLRARKTKRYGQASVYLSSAITLGPWLRPVRTSTLLLLVLHNTNTVYLLPYTVYITTNCNNLLDAAYCFQSNAQKMRHFKSRFFLLCEARLLPRSTRNIKIAVPSWCIEGGSFQTRTGRPTVTLRHCENNTVVANRGQLQVDHFNSHRR